MPAGRLRPMRRVSTGSAPSLQAGEYQIHVEIAGFRTLEQEAEVEAGTSTTVNISMAVGESKEVVTVEAATAQINYENQAVEGVVARQTIQDLPLNGRSFMQLSRVWSRESIVAAYRYIPAKCRVHGFDHGRRNRKNSDDNRWSRSKWTTSRAALAGMNFSRRSGAGVPAFGPQLRHFHRNRRRGRDQRGNTFGRQRFSRQRLFLLSRSRYGSLSSLEAKRAGSQPRSLNGGIRGSGSVVRSSRTTSCSSSPTMST